MFLIKPVMRANSRLYGPVSRIDLEREGVRDEHEEQTQHNPIQSGLLSTTRTTVPIESLKGKT
jgi:hypothetical protein